MRYPMFFRRETVAQRWWRTAPVIAATLLIYWVSSIPDATPPDLGFEWQDKVFHATAYLVYGVAMFLAVWAWARTRSTTSILWIGGILAALYAVADEWHQSFVPGRHATLDDAVADIVGICLAAFLFRLLLRR